MLRHSVDLVSCVRREVGDPRGPAGALLDVVAAFAESLAVDGRRSTVLPRRLDVVVVPDHGIAPRSAADAAVAKLDELGQEPVEAAAGGLHRDQASVGRADEQPTQGGLRCLAGAADQVGAERSGEEPDSGDQAGLGAVAEQGLDADDETDPHRRRVGRRVEAGDAGGEGVSSDLASGAWVTLGAGALCRGVEGRADGGEDLERQDGRELTGAVVELTAGDATVGAGATVAASLSLGRDPEARATDRLTQTYVTETGQARREVVVDLSALLGVEVRDLAGDGERAVLGQVSTRQCGQRLREVVAQPPRQQHSLLARVGAGEGRERDLCADRHRARRRTPVGRRVVLGVGGVRKSGCDCDLRRRHSGLDPVQGLELVEVVIGGPDGSGRRGCLPTRVGPLPATYWMLVASPASPASLERTFEYGVTGPPVKHSTVNRFGHEGRMTRRARSTSLAETRSAPACNARCTSSAEAASLAWTSRPRSRRRCRCSESGRRHRRGRRRHPTWPPCRRRGARRPGPASTRAGGTRTARCGQRARGASAWPAGAGSSP